MKKWFIFLPLVPVSFLLHAQNSRGETLAANSNNQFVTLTDNNGVTTENQITVSKEGAITLLTFWEETNNGFLFKDVNWKGNVVVELANGKSIRLVDRHLHGQEMLKGGYVAGYYVPDLYQRYSSYYLTDDECELLKKSEIVKVAYHINDEYETETLYMNFDPGISLQGQLTAISK